MSFFDVYQFECSKKNLFNIQINRLIRVTAKVDFLFKFSLQSLNFNVFATRISIFIFTKRKWTTKKLNFEKRNRESKFLLETIQNENVKRRKMTKNMLLIKEIQHNETFQKKTSLTWWKEEKTSTHVRSSCSKKSNFFYIIVSYFIIFEKIERWFLIFEFWFFKRFFFSLSSSSFLFSVLCEISSTMFHDDWKLIARFYSALNDLSRKECNVCNEIEFTM
jgi:hypothetical protein